MACPGCSSGNVEKLSHYWESLPAESPLKFRYAPPALPPTQYLLVLVAVLAGIWIAWTGEPLWGLGISVAGLVWGAVMTAAAAAAQARRDEWASTQLCLTCTRRWS